jgi:DNA-binding response OmpR family regulator
MDRLPLVLVIDEDARHRAHLTSILEQSGFPCAAAPPDEGALDLAARVNPGIVLLRLREGEAGARLREEVGRRAPRARILRFVSIDEA